MKTVLHIAMLFVGCTLVQAQELNITSMPEIKVPLWDASRLNWVGTGGEVQVYPAGVIGVATILVEINTAIHLGLTVGWNQTDRHDWGKHDDEKGGGAGFGGYLRYYLFGQDQTGWYTGARMDLWFMDIDWRDERDGELVFGETYITVLQPTLQAGYAWRLLENEHLHLETGVSFGGEINVNTSGEDVGQGPIFLVGVGADYRF